MTGILVVNSSLFESRMPEPLNPPAQLLTAIAKKADTKPHQVIPGTHKGENFVLLTRKHYDELRAALYLILGAMGNEVLHIDVRTARKAKGWTQLELAKHAGIPQSQISRIERNSDATTIRSLKRITAVLGVPVSSLLKP